MLLAALLPIGEAIEGCVFGGGGMASGFRITGIVLGLCQTHSLQLNSETMFPSGPLNAARTHTSPSLGEVSAWRPGLSPILRAHAEGTGGGGEADGFGGAPAGMTPVSRSTNKCPLRFTAAHTSQSPAGFSEIASRSSEALRGTDSGWRVVDGG